MSYDELKNQINELEKEIERLDKNDKLDTIFTYQKTFDVRVQVPYDRVKRGKSFDESKMPVIPSVGRIVDNTFDERYTDYDWVKMLAFCLLRECTELIDKIGWKHWKKVELVSEFSKTTVNLIRDEIADMWHFLVSLTLRAGMNADDVLKYYKIKWEINNKRQDEGYGDKK
jgi:phosphoribosyl-ATP pyrophosphohydrolase